MARLWLELSLDQKQRLQKVLFPGGLSFSSERGFGTAAISNVFNALQHFEGGKSSLATLTSANWNQIIAALKSLAFFATPEQALSDAQLNAIGKTP